MTRQPPTLPRGFHIHVANIGIKDTSLDFAVAYSDAPCTSAAVFTKSRFAGPSVTVSREHAAKGDAQGIVVVSKNANVATGEEGQRNAEELAKRTAGVIGVPANKVLVASTGVIGRQYPMPKLQKHFAGLKQSDFTASLEDMATAVMTTDTVIKTATANVGNARLTGIAKGVGMIEPDMATLLVFVFTDAKIAAPKLQAAFKKAMNSSFNSLSIDTDTSTSDTAIILANGQAGPVDEAEFTRALTDICIDLTKQIARDGEGATKLIEVHVSGARDDHQAKKVAKAIVNSPLVKTAVHGADPNWGRVAMAIGKCSDETDIVPEKTTISFQSIEVYPHLLDEAGLEKVATELKRPEVIIAVNLGIANGKAVVWGCDLSREYIAINADYTT